VKQGPNSPEPARNWPPYRGLENYSKVPQDLRGERDFFPSHRFRPAKSHPPPPFYLLSRTRQKGPFSLVLTPKQGILGPFHGVSGRIGHSIGVQMTPSELPPPCVAVAWT
jgi:hypothetical protein